MQWKVAMCAGTVLSIACAGVYAHHSGVMFDKGKSLALAGVVREFQWTNPHCWIQLQVLEGEHQGEWSVELGNPTQLYRLGWRPATLQPGQAVTLQVHPMRDGSQAALFVSGTDSDNHPLGAGGQAR